MAERSGTMAAMHKDDLERIICALFAEGEGREFVDGLGKRIAVSAHKQPGEEPVFVVKELDSKYAGRVEWTSFRIGR